MQRKLLIFVCVTAGKQASVKKDITESMKINGIIHKIILVEKPPDIPKKLARLHLNSYSAVAVYGGDGSVIQAIKALSYENLPLIILPGGTANVLASYYNMPATLNECLEMYASQTYINDRSDLADINGNPFVLDMHTGLWTDAIMDTPRSMKRRVGKIAYGLTAVRKLRTAKPHTYEFKIDSKPIEKRKAYTFLVANQGDHSVLNTPLFPYSHAPGMVQIALFKDLRFSRLLIWLLWRKLTGKNIQRIIEVRRAHKLLIEKSPKKLLVDDNKQQAKLPINITGGQYSIRILVPATVSQRSKLLVWRSRIRLSAHRLWQRFKVMLPGSTPSLRHSHVAPGIYLGGKYPKRAYKTFAEWGISGIISMRTSQSAAAPLGFSLLRLPTQDWHPPTLKDLEKGVEFIRHHREQGGSVYIHCQLGEGRGPTMAAAYLITKGFTVEEAVKQLVKHRPFVQPNGRQLKRLAEWQEYVNKQTSSR